MSSGKRHSLLSSRGHGMHWIFAGMLAFFGVSLLVGMVYVFVQPFVNR